MKEWERGLGTAKSELIGLAKRILTQTTSRSTHSMLLAAERRAALGNSESLKEFGVTLQLVSRVTQRVILAWRVTCGERDDGTVVGRQRDSVPLITIETKTSPKD